MLQAAQQAVAVSTAKKNPTPLKPATALGRKVISAKRACPPPLYNRAACYFLPCYKRQFRDRLLS
jgi:hypothetical protein